MNKSRRSLALNWREGGLLTEWDFYREFQAIEFDVAVRMNLFIYILWNVAGRPMFDYVNRHLSHAASRYFKILGQ